MQVKPAARMTAATAVPSAPPPMTEAEKKLVATVMEAITAQYAANPRDREFGLSQATKGDRADLQEGRIPTSIMGDHRQIPVLLSIKLSGDLTVHIGRRPAWQGPQAPAGEGAGLVYCYDSSRGISGSHLFSDWLADDELKKFGVTRE